MPTANTKLEEEACKTLIRATIGLFAALIGFGLNRLLESDKEEIAADRAACFIVLLLVAVRIVCGAAIHLTDTHLRQVAPSVYAPESNTQPANKAALRALFDVLMLVLFGVLLSHDAHASTLRWYFISLTIASVAMIFWAWFDHNDDPEHPLRIPYLVLNLVSAIAFAFLASFSSLSPNGQFWSGHMSGFGLFSIALAFFVAALDLQCQFYFLFNGMSMEGENPPLLVRFSRVGVEK